MVGITGITGTKDERSVEEKVSNKENLFRHSLRTLAVRWEWEIKKKKKEKLVPA